MHYERTPRFTRLKLRVGSVHSRLTLVNFGY